MNGSNPGWFEGRIHKLKTLLIDGWIKYQLFEWIIGQTDGWLVRRINGKTNGSNQWMDRSMNKHIVQLVGLTN